MRGREPPTRPSRPRRWPSRAGATLLRGGAFKPRTSPYAFQGLGVEGLEILADVGAATGLPVVTEVVDARDVAVVAEHADMLQIGTRNMANFGLLQAVGAAGKPVLLKRGMTATIEEWLMAAEYIAQRGNLDVVLCERGIRTFETATATPSTSPRSRSCRRPATCRSSSTRATPPAARTSSYRCPAPRSRSAPTA